MGGGAVAIREKPIRSSREAKLALGARQTVAVLFSVQEVHRAGRRQAAQGRGSPQFQCTLSGDLLCLPGYPSLPFLAPGLPVPLCLGILQLYACPRHSRLTPS